MSVLINDKYAKPGGGLKGKIPFKSPTGERYGHIPEAVFNVINKYGTDAHMYLPGAQTPVLGPELVVNGDGSSTVGWTGVYGGNVASVGGEFVVTCTGASQYSGMSSPIELQAGKRYALSYTVVDASMAVGVYAFIAQVVTGDSFRSLTFGQHTTADTYRTEFIAGYSGGSYVIASAGSGGLTIGETIKFKNISVREILSYSDTYQGFHTSNYIDSAGTQPAVYDQPVGLVLDAAGSIGAEITGGFNSGWVGTGWTFSGGVASAAATTNNAFRAATLVAGKTYCVTLRCSSFTAGGYKVLYEGGQSLIGDKTTTGTFTANLVANASGGLYIWANSTLTATFDYISVREVTGIHASQQTVGYKPVDRRGIVNRLLYSAFTGNPGGSNTFPSNWQITGSDGNCCSLLSSGAVPGAQAVAIRGTAGGGYQGLQRVGSAIDGIVINEAYTVFVYVRVPTGVTASSLHFYSGTGNPGLTQIASAATLNAQPKDEWVLRAAQISFAVIPNTISLCIPGTTLGNGFDVSAPAIFKGVVTESEVLKAGGIPLTTTAPASSSAGNAYLEFDGVDDSLTLSGSLFQMADDHCVVAAFTPEKLQATFSAPSYSGNNRFAAINTTSGGQFLVEWYDGTTYVPLAVECTLGVPVVITAWKVEGNLIARKNGVQFGIGSAFSTAVQATTGAIGTGPIGVGKGRIHANPIVKGTLTLADVQLLEKFAAQRAGIQL